MAEVTTIRVDVETRDMLKELWRSADDTYDIVIKRLIKEAKAK